MSKQNKSRIIDNNSKSNQNVSFTKNSIMQFTPYVITTKDELKKLSLEQLSFFVSQSIRKDLYGITMPWKGELSINYDNLDLIKDLKIMHSLNSIGEDMILYENMSGMAYGKDIIYPGLDSCLGITIIKRNREPIQKKELT